MKFYFVQEHCATWPVRVMCAVLGISVSGYYAWRNRAESKRTAANRQLLGEIRRIHADSSGVYGSPRIHAVLRRTGQPVGRSRVEILMRCAGLRGLAALPRRARTTHSRHSLPVAPNRLARNFTTQRPNQIWLADLTYIPTGEGWLYLAAVLDVCTRKIVGWSMRDTLHTEIALDALAMALQRQRPGAGLIHHSDRGIQYAAEVYRQTLAAANITPSMSRKGNCWDNAPMESFFHTLKTERVHHRIYATKEQAKRDLFAYIEGFYNSHRLHSTLGYLSPAERERAAA
jgi:putative transposase